MDDLDRRVMNALQGGFPLGERPFREAAAELGMAEEDLIRRIAALLANGAATRFGPLFDIGRLQGAFSLCAMCVPPGDFERVAGLVNARPEVAHNYERAHRLNMWFVLACEDPADVGRVLREIEDATGYAVMNLPREAEFRIDLRLAA